MTINVAINGFGRIGRSILRIIVEEDIDLNVVAINDLGDYENLAYLFKHDSIMGILNADISIQNDIFKINDREIKLISISFYYVIYAVGSLFCFVFGPNYI